MAATTSHQDASGAKRARETDILWRMDPVDSFSDWTLIIEYEDQAEAPKGVGKDAGETVDSDQEQRTPTKKRDTYHVHKCLLAAGTHSSGYFRKICSQNGSFQESSSKTSTISVDASVAKQVPTLLDYIYMYGKTENPCTIENAVSLFWLSNYLDIPILDQLVLAFCEKNLTPKNCAVFFELGIKLRCDPIKEMLIKFCSGKLFDAVNLASSSDFQACSQIKNLIVKDGLMHPLFAENYFDAAKFADRFPHSLLVHNTDLPPAAQRFKYSGIINGRPKYQHDVMSIFYDDDEHAWVFNHTGKTVFIWKCKKERVPSIIPPKDGWKRKSTNAAIIFSISYEYRA